MHAALVLAKRGSIGLPNKNLLQFQGRPLLVHALEEIFASHAFDAVYVSTNWQEAAELARNTGARVILRDDVLARNDQYVQAVDHAIRSMTPAPDTITIVQAVQPLRESGLFGRMLALHGPDVDSVVTITPFQSAVDWIFACGHDGEKLQPIEQIQYGETMARRTDLGVIDNAVVSFTHASWQRGRGITAWPYLGSNVVGVVQRRLNPHYEVDINVPEDAEWLEFVASYPSWLEARRREGKT